MLLKLMNTHNDMILVNTESITKVRPYNLTTEKGIVIRFGNGESEEMIPNITVEEFLVKCHQDDSTKMFETFMKRFEHFEKIVKDGFTYVGKSI